jgi:hypothetical protein
VAVRTRDLYYGRELRVRKDQEVAFLSYRELIESIRIPRGREVTWVRFRGLV